MIAKTAIALTAFAAGLITASAMMFSNGDFENAEDPFPSGWRITGSPASVASIVSNGASSASLANGQFIEQDFAPAAFADDALDAFTVTLAFRITNTAQTGRIRFEGNNGADALSIRFNAASSPDSVQVYNGSSWFDVSGLTNLTLNANTTYHLKITGTAWKGTGRSYKIGFAVDGTNFTTSPSLSAFHASAATGGFETISFEGKGSGALVVDNVVLADPNANQPPVIAAQPASVGITGGGRATLTVGATGAAPLGYQWYQGAAGVTTNPVGTNSARFTTPVVNGSSSYWVRVANSQGIADSESAAVSVAPPDKVVNISGVYPHLAMTNTHLECGVGAVVPWAGKLWVITYGPHIPNGGTDRLYEISSDLSRVIRAESVGGTPANRFIHHASNQLNIGPYFIDARRNVRVLRPAGSKTGVIPGRITATAAHLTDPNRLYLFTMENGLYDVDVNDLTYITRYPDLQSMGDNFLSGYHGKGAYTGQGRVVVGNNGESNQTYPSGVLATWNGTVNELGATPGRMVAWNEIERIQTCKVTGPGGITGNPKPATDPVWTTGFDARSVVLHTMENNTFCTWRLPKSSYTHDGAHGWHTEWPRIRKLDPDDPQSMYLMHMHGLFFDFPKAFSSANFFGLEPISSYFKMPTDYCMFNGSLVMGRNDASQFANAFALKCQSKLWFGDLGTVRTRWGAPTGHGSVWMNQPVTADQLSDPFLIQGFAQRTLHLRNLGSGATTVEIQTSNGTPTWATARTITVPAGAYSYEIISDLTASWVRLRNSASTSNLTAFFHLHTPYPYQTPASSVGDEFAGLADIRDRKSMSDGIIRVMNNAALELEFASSRTSSSAIAGAHRYHRIGGPLELGDVTDPAAESGLRSAAVLTREFGSDSASAWVAEGSVRYRLPKLDPLYDAPFAAGWARGIREAVTERELLNCHGTFYEVPRDVSGGMRKMRALVTHGKRITDFASWRGLLVLTGVLDDAPPSDRLVRNADGSAALWLGEIDDIWRMGEPRGKGGPGNGTTVPANATSDPYLMYGYDRKELTLIATAATTITIEVDLLADNTWSTYQAFDIAAGETRCHVFPTGYHAHWVRVRSSAATTATAQFTYCPADARDAFLDRARDHGLPTGCGRTAAGSQDGDHGGTTALLEFLTNGSPSAVDSNPITFIGSEAVVITRNLAPTETTLQRFEFSTNLRPGSWVSQPGEVVPEASQAGFPAGFTRYRILTRPGENRLFFCLFAS